MNTTTTTPPVSGPHPPPPPTSQPPPNLEKVHQAQALESLLREIEQRVDLKLFCWDLKLIVLHFLFVFDREDTLIMLEETRFPVFLAAIATLAFHILSFQHGYHLYFGLEVKTMKIFGFNLEDRSLR